LVTRVTRKVIMSKKIEKKEEDVVRYVYIIPLENNLLGKVTIPFCIPAGGDVAEKAKEYIMSNNLNYLGGRLFVQVGGES
jgi:hypothetical protein